MRTGTLKGLTIAVLAACVLPTMAFARVAGGGSKKSDCYAQFEGVTSTNTTVSCADGDPTCDTDGVVNDVCQFGINVCAHTTGIAECTSPDVTEIKLGQSFSKFSTAITLPTLPATAETCGTAGAVSLSVRVNKKGKKLPSKPLRLKMTTKASGKPAKDPDKLTLICKPGVPACTANSAGGPKELRIRIKNEGQDLDTGWTGASHNSLNVGGSTYRVCLTGCNAAGDTDCTEDEAATQNANGTDFGPPLPLLSSGVATCVRNRYDTTKITGTVANIKTGAITTTVNLISEVYTTSQTAVCPTCSGGSFGAVGSCQGGANNGQTCTVQGVVTISGKVYNLSEACQPSGSPIGTLNIPLSPLTTASGSKDGTNPCPGQTRNNNCGNNADGNCTTGGGTGAGCTQPTGKGFSQYCCTNNPTQACFPTEAGNPVLKVQATGAPDVPAAVGGGATPLASEPTLASAFCIAATGSALVNGVAGLPGPGVTTMPVDVCWLTDDTDLANCPNK